MSLSKALSRASFFTAQFLRDYADPTIDVSSLEYAMATEEIWAPDLRRLRLSGSDTPREVGWAEFRYNWCDSFPRRIC